MPEHTLAESGESKVLLEIRNVTKRFGGVIAVRRCSLDVRDGEIHSLIGPNGAGKTTLFNMVSRLLSLTEGSITFDGADISRMKPDQLARAGLARTFQIVRLVDNLSVLQNVMLGAYCHTTSWLPATGLGLPSVRREEKRIEDDARACLAFTGFDLGEDADVEGLPYGKQRIVEIARALTMRPKLLLLDEPAAGLNIQETAQLSRLIKEIRGTGITVFLVEHDMSLVMSISDRITVLNYGEILADGTPHEISGNQQVIDAYLGEVAKC